MFRKNHITVDEVPQRVHPDMTEAIYMHLCLDMSKFKNSPVKYAIDKLPSRLGYDKVKQTIDTGLYSKNAFDLLGIDKNAIDDEHFLRPQHIIEMMMYYKDNYNYDLFNIVFNCICHITHTTGDENSLLSGGLALDNDTKKKIVYTLTEDLYKKADIFLWDNNEKDWIDEPLNPLFWLPKNVAYDLQKYEEIFYEG